MFIEAAPRKLPSQHQLVEGIHSFVDDAFVSAHIAHKFQPIWHQTCLGHVSNILLMRAMVEKTSLGSAALSTEKVAAVAGRTGKVRAM